MRANNQALSFHYEPSNQFGKIFFELQNHPIRYTQDPIARCCEKGIFDSVNAGLAWIIVDLAIEFDHQPEFRAEEINNVVTDRNLPPKLQAEHAAVTEQYPGSFLSARIIAAHLSGPPEKSGRVTHDGVVVTNV